MTTEVGHSNDGVEVEQQMFAVIPQIYFGDAPGLVEPKTATPLTTNATSFERATSTTEDTTITLIIQVATAIIVLVIVLWLLITLMRSTLPEKKLGKKQ